MNSTLQAGRRTTPSSSSTSPSRASAATDLGVERGGSPRCGGDEPQGVRAALAERAFEAGLLPERLVASAARRAFRRQRTGVATRNPGEADRGAEIEESLQRSRAERVPGPLLDSSDVGVDGKHVVAEGLISDRRGGVRADSRQVGQVVGPPVRRRSPAPHDGARPPAGCSRAPAIRGSRRRASPRRGRQAWASAPARRSSAGSRAPPASAAASPRRRGSRTGRACSRQGRERPFSLYQAESSSSTHASVVVSAPAAHGACT